MASCCFRQSDNLPRLIQPQILYPVLLNKDISLSVARELSNKDKSHFYKSLYSTYFHPLSLHQYSTGRKPPTRRYILT
nr:MAG TPA: hypothetical protein [Caudoviricetes sp.]